MSILFTQYLLPNGRKEPQHIERTAEIEAIATRFIDSGEVSLTAVKTIRHEEQDVAIVLTKNHPDKVGPAVDKLVLLSQEFIEVK
jgi:hypothetical protein